MDLSAFDGLEYKPGYEWIHPSWRDLVIEYLRDHKVSRQRFLLKAGISGCMLALSGEGGATGSRSFPLLIDRDDWRLLTDSLQALLAGGDGNQIPAAFSGLEDATARAKSSVNSEDITCFTTLVMRALDAARQRWNAERAIVPSWVLATYFRLSLLAKPLSPSPDLTASWSEAWRHVESCIKGNDAELDTALESVEDCIALIGIISQNEPRFLRAVEFPERYVATIDAVINNLLSQWGDAAFTSGKKSEFTAQIDLAERIDSVSTSIGEELSSLTEKCNAVVTNVGAIRTTLEQRRDEKFPPDDDDEGRYDEDDEGESVNVIDMFIDL